MADKPNICTSGNHHGGKPCGRSLTSVRYRTPDGFSRRAYLCPRCDLHSIRQAKAARR